MFFTVSEKNIDPRKDHSLSSDSHQATVTAKLATRNEKDFEVMTRLSCQNAHGLLLEFPGVLLATCVPILENIQDMQRLSRLPYRQWILPDRVSSLGAGPETLHIPPPLYARAPGFAFPLNTILREADEQMSLNSRESVDNKATIDELEERTRLDRGQCQALIAALTREFAFIQGPPGTGKSHLGVQLMRVILACRTKADLGPVVVL